MIKVKMEKEQAEMLRLCFYAAILAIVLFAGMETIAKILVSIVVGFLVFNILWIGTGIYKKNKEKAGKKKSGNEKTEE